MCVCRACGKEREQRARGLCRPCHDDTRIRRRYPSVSPFGQRGHEPMAIVVAVMPTPHLPGSAGKILAMRERAALRQPLFHPRDAVPSL